MKIFLHTERDRPTTLMVSIAVQEKKIALNLMFENLFIGWKSLLFFVIVIVVVVVAVDFHFNHIFSLKMVFNKDLHTTFTKEIVQRKL